MRVGGNESSQLDLIHGHCACCLVPWPCPAQRALDAAVLNFLRRHPGQHEQAGWIVADDDQVPSVEGDFCGTAICFAGWALVLHHGGQPNRFFDWLASDEPHAEHAYVATKDAVPATVRVVFENVGVVKAGGEPRHTCTPGLIGSAYGCPVCMPWTASDLGGTTE